MKNLRGNGGHHIDPGGGTRPYIKDLGGGSGHHDPDGGGGH